MHASDRLDLAVPVSPTDHVRGPMHAPITVLEYGDFECPVCRAAEPGVRMLLERFGATIRFVYRHFPMESVHPHALIAAEATEAAAAQGQFWAMHDRLMQHEARLDRKALDQHAAALGLDLASFAAALDDEIYRQRIREQMDGALRSHLRATPGFYVNGRVCDVSGGVHALGERVAELLGEARR
ncbi:MAG TPA: thioredoxin domain-containing protein [Steroidobacteraceae bacterium]|nr:thioredoxin domain-containing protein [Steroidobacteraceae bacterium]